MGDFVSMATTLTDFYCEFTFVDDSGVLKLS